MFNTVDLGLNFWNILIQSFPADSIRNSTINNRNDTQESKDVSSYFDHRFSWVSKLLNNQLWSLNITL